MMQRSSVVKACAVVALAACWTTLVACTTETTTTTTAPNPDAAAPVDEETPPDSQDAGVDASQTTPDAQKPAPVVKRVFATATMRAGGLPPAEADVQCNTDAAAAKLAGTWKAWISDSTTDAAARIKDVGPWYLTDGQTVAFANAAALTKKPAKPLLNEQGGAIRGTYGAWTGTIDGKRTKDNCNDWSTLGTAYGTVTRVDEWTTSVLNCATPYRLICIEQ